MPAALYSQYETQWINMHTGDQWGTTMLLRQGIRKHRYVCENMPAPLNSHYETQWINMQAYRRPMRDKCITELKNTKTSLRHWKIASSSYETLRNTMNNQAYRRPMRDNYATELRNTKTPLRQWVNARSSLQPFWNPVDKQAYRWPVSDNYVTESRNTKKTYVSFLFRDFFINF